MNFLTRRQFYRKNLLSFLHLQPDLHLLTEIPGNLGDHLIWEGTKDLLASGGVCYTSIPLSKVGEEDRPRSTLLVPGSGALSKHYHEWLPAAALTASSRFQKVIILPSSFDLTVPIVAECLSQPNVYAFAREVQSYRFAKSLGRVALCLDCAIYFNKFTDTPACASAMTDEGNLLLALREDKESLLAGQGLVPNPSLNQDISLTTINLDEWITAIDRVSTVVTDRLHVAVASALLGKKLNYLDPDGLKITNYFNFTFRDAFDDRIDRRSSGWLIAKGFAVKRTAT